MTTAPTTPTQMPRRERVRTRGLLRRKAAAAFLDMGTSTFDRHDAAGLLPAAVRIGGCKAWSRRELLAWIEASCPKRSEWAAVWRARLAARRTK